jgi:hypothetical protein
MGRNAKIKAQRKIKQSPSPLTIIKGSIDDCLSNNRRTWIIFPKSKDQFYRDAISFYKGKYPVLFDIYEGGTSLEDNNTAIAISPFSMGFVKEQNKPN